MSDHGYSVTGKVVVSNNGAGIADVLVALFVRDPRATGDTTFSAMTRTGGERLARRLGSTLTDSGGRFAFRFGDHACAPIDPCRGPDLVVVAVSPEAGEKDEESHAEPYLATARISGAGREEAVVLRVEAARLERAGLRAPTEQAHRDLLMRRVSSSLGGSVALHAAVRRAGLEQTQQRMKQVLEPRLKANNAIKPLSLSRFDASVREGALYVDHRAPVGEKLAVAVDARLKAIPQKLDSGVSRRLRLFLDDDTLRMWGVRPSPNGDLDPNLPFFKVVERLRKLIGGGPLERSRSWLEVACAEKQAEEDVARTIERCTARTGTNGNGGGTTATNGGASDTSSLVRDHVSKQLSLVTPPEVELTYGALDADGSLTATITKSGPADVTAYHDFHDLQIAFEHVWSEAFDDRIPKIFRDLYADMVKFSNKASGVPLPPVVQNVDDMRSLYEEFRSLVDLVESADQPEPQAPDAVPDDVKQLLPQITDAEWTAADTSSRSRLLALADEYVHAADFTNALSNAADLDHFGETPGDHRNRLRNEANAIYAAMKRHVTPPAKKPGAPKPGATSGSTRLREMFDELDQRLAEPYRFDVFARDSVNVGIMLTYRQKWVPLDYQVGSLVSTIPLGPKEVRRYSTKRVVKKTRSERELVDQEQSSRVERGTTSRADSEIVKQARDKTSFEATASGTINVGVFQGQFGTKFGVDAEKASSDTKKNFREAVLKAADEFRRKHTTEVQLSTSEEVETTTSGELVNPNDEITVTYLFYELQRQYDISEHLHRLTPVVLVANDVPKPHEVDEDWLIANQWVIGRALLDEGQRPALQYLASSIAGDELALEALRVNVERQVAVVEEITRQVAAKTKLSESAFAELRTLVNRAKSVDDANKIQQIATAMFLGPLALAGSGGNDDAMKRQEDIAKMALERADQATQQVTARLTTEVSTLQESIDKYVKALRAYFDHALAVSALRIHVKQNILYYMQAIWDHEPSDQRYFRLYNVPVPWIEAVDAGSLSPTSSAPATGGWAFETMLFLERQSEPVYTKTTRPLAEVADLDNLLGYKGNYMIFAAKEASYLHLYMMQDYLDESGALRDPDGTGTMSSREILDAICCLQKHAPDVVTARREDLEKMLKERMAGPRRESELVIVPTDSLYIEALPGSHPVMEPFKRVHRALDVKKVQGEVRHGELENVRLAARLLAGERGDPDIEKVVQVREGDGINVNT